MNVPRVARTGAVRNWKRRQFPHVRPRHTAACFNTALCFADRTDAMFFQHADPPRGNFTRSKKPFCSFRSRYLGQLAGKTGCPADSLTNPCDGRTGPCRLLQWKARLSDVCFGKGAGNKGITLTLHGFGKRHCLRPDALRHATGAEYAAHCLFPSPVDADGADRRNIPCISAGDLSASITAEPETEEPWRRRLLRIGLRKEWDKP